MPNIFNQLLTNRVFLICLLTWFVSQSVKFFVYYAKEHFISYNVFLRSGGMPSSHSAITMTFATLVYLDQGVSMLFLLYWYLC